MMISILDLPERRQYPYTIKPVWAMGYLEYEFYRDTSLTRREQRNHMVVRPDNLSLYR